MRTDSRELLALGMFGASPRLADRIELLLRRRQAISAHVSRSRLGVSGAILLALAIGGSRVPQWIAFAQETPRPRFEVASVKPADSSDQRFFIGSQPGGNFRASASLKMLIATAYDLRTHQISGGPGWIDSSKFEVDAKAENGAIAPGPAGGPAMRVRLQSLLEERFRLMTHRETRQEQVYELVVAKGGTKMKEATDTAKGPRQGMQMGRGQLTGMAAPVAILVNILSQQLGRTVIDKTGLTANYDFMLTYTPDPQQGTAFGPPGPDLPPPPDPNGPTIFTAIKEQLGLELRSARGPVEVLVIDYAEKPDAN